MTDSSLEAVLLTQPDCLGCNEARELLARLAFDYPLKITEYQLASPAGQHLAERHLLLFAPALVLGGEPFGYGHFREADLRLAIERCLPGTHAPKSLDLRKPAGTPPPSRARRVVTRLFGKA